MERTQSKKQSFSANNGRNGMTAEKGKSKVQRNSSREDEGMLGELFHDELKDIYWAEKHLVKTLPKMAKAASSPDLKNAFNDHLQVTKGHVEKLERVFGEMGWKPQTKKCEAMEGLTKEGDGIIEDTESGTSTRDVGLILAAQKVEHYEIATYGGLATLAKTLNNENVSDILGSILEEEKEADETLTEIAEGHVNMEAEKEEE